MKSFVLSWFLILAALVGALVILKICFLVMGTGWAFPFALVIVALALMLMKKP